MWRPGVCQGSIKLPHLRIERAQGEILVVICDEDLLGKKFDEGELTLEVERSFYEGEEVSVERCLDALKEATIANMVGSIIRHAIDAGLVKATNVIKIQDVPHAQMVRL